MPALRRVMYFGALTNMLAFMPSVYMLEVYDRVVSSRSHVTLGMLTLLVVVAYIWLEVLEWLRAEMLHHAAAQMDTRIAPAIFGKLFDAHLLRRGGANLSGGIRQRIGLARALYGDPALLVLDEPNSSLDDDGDISLMGALAQAKARGTALVVVTHRPQILDLADKLLILREGQMQAFGPREQVVEALKQAMAKARAGEGAA